MFIDVSVQLVAINKYLQYVCLCVRCECLWCVKECPKLSFIEKAKTELAQLKKTGFGRPRPRHGLKLLHWIAVHLRYSEMKMYWSSQSKDYGFHQFHNIPQTDGYILLPIINKLTYHTVGNLNINSEKPLPGYISNEFTGHHDQSNIDRVIIGVDEHSYARAVYISKHYNRHATTQISWELLMYISLMSLEKFLSETGYYES
ncbi:uncharacterized protein LOC128317983 [Pangasianodon hypophthalmus]|uniref:uncharacterized protein LOC128317983 n=1 Tax=Pangasianodon hypophthalmus TaxID=310915 RepID=UPI0023080AEE|nr:uncharacterized protein LOC128317983 [Pangasianodon hypophthalmus]